MTWQFDFCQISTLYENANGSHCAKHILQRHLEQSGHPDSFLEKYPTHLTPHFHSMWDPFRYRLNTRDVRISRILWSVGGAQGVREIALFVGVKLIYGLHVRSQKVKKEVRVTKGIQMLMQTTGNKINTKFIISWLHYSGWGIFQSNFCGCSCCRCLQGESICSHALERD